MPVLFVSVIAHGQAGMPVLRFVELRAKITPRPWLCNLTQFVSVVELIELTAHLFVQRTRTSIHSADARLVDHFELSNRH